MRIFLEEIDDTYYGDIVISYKEMNAIRLGQMVDGYAYIDNKRCYLGVRKEGNWEDEEEDPWPEED